MMETKEMKETAPTIRCELTKSALKIEWGQKGQPAVEEWMLYVGTKAKTEHPEGGFQWELCSTSMRQETHEYIPLARLPRGREIYMQVGRIITDEKEKDEKEEIFSSIINISVPKESDKMAEEHAQLKTVVQRFKKRPAEVTLHDRH